MQRQCTGNGSRPDCIREVMQKHDINPSFNQLAWPILLCRLFASNRSFCNNDIFNSFKQPVLSTSGSKSKLPGVINAFKMDFFSSCLMEKLCAICLCTSIHLEFTDWSISSDDSYAWATNPSNVATYSHAFSNLNCRDGRPRRWGCIDCSD